MAATYSFKDVTVAYASPTGATANLGYGSAAAKEGITIEPTGDKNTMTIGADGSPMHSLHADDSGSLTIRLLKVSPMNAFLQSQYDAQKLATSLWGQNVFTIRQTQSGDTTVCLQSAFARKPSIKYGEEGDVMEYHFHVGKMNSILGTY